MPVKGNQERLRFAIADRCRDLPLTSATHISTENIGHGRSERRTLVVLPVTMDDDISWPQAQQMGNILRVRIKRRTGQILSQERVCFITSLTPTQASPADLLQIGRGHWTIENKVHYVRDVTFREDASRVRKGSLPQVFAAFRNLVLTVLRRARVTNIATALVRNAANPLRPIAYLLL